MNGTGKPVGAPPPNLSGIGSPSMYPQGGDEVIPGSLAGPPMHSQPNALPQSYQTAMGGQRKRITMGDRIAAAAEALAKVGDGPSHGGGGGFPGGPSPGQLEALPNMLKMLMRPRVG